MENKDLLFMLEGGEQFIKGIYKACEDKIYFLSADEETEYENVSECIKDLLCIFEEDRLEFEILTEEIINDKTLLDRIKSKEANKLLFKYENREFKRLLDKTMIVID